MRRSPATSGDPDRNVCAQHNTTFAASFEAYSSSTAAGRWTNQRLAQQLACHSPVVASRPLTRFTPLTTSTTMTASSAGPSSIASHLPAKPCPPPAQAGAAVPHPAHPTHFPFPYTPYPAQQQLMQAVFDTIQSAPEPPPLASASSSSSSHMARVAILESPTGTGQRLRAQQSAAAPCSAVWLAD